MKERLLATFRREREAYQRLVKVVSNEIDLAKYEAKLFTLEMVINELEHASNDNFYNEAAIFCVRQYSACKDSIYAAMRKECYKELSRRLGIEKLKAA